MADVARKLALHALQRRRTRHAEILRWCEGAASQFDDARIQSFVPIPRRAHRQQPDVPATRPRSHRHQTPIRVGREPATERPCAKARIAMTSWLNGAMRSRACPKRTALRRQRRGRSLAVRSEGDNVRPRIGERAVVNRRLDPPVPLLGYVATDSSDVVGSGRGGIIEGRPGTAAGSAWSGRRRCRLRAGRAGRGRWPASRRSPVATSSAG